MSEVRTPAAGASRVVPPSQQASRRWLDRRPVVWAIRIATFVIVIGVWQLLTKDVNRALFAPPTDVAGAIVRQLTQEPSIWGPLFASFVAFAIGMSLGVLVGIPVGLLLGRYRTLEFVLDPYVTFLYVIPSVAFVPLFILWFGFSFEFQVALVFESTLFPMVINAAAGAKNVEQDLIDGGRSFCASESQIMRTIVVPASLPFVFAGLRIAFSAAWVGVVIAQMTGAITGLGGLILDYAATYRTADMLVPILVIMLVGVIIHALTGWLLMRVTPWYQGRREADG
jgi:ABC-type nitrate/sulfonate/bicarbonate transport system permease component